MLEKRLAQEARYEGSFSMADYRLPYERALDKGRNIADYLANSSVSQGIHDLVGYARNKAYDLSSALALPRPALGQQR